MNRGLIFLTIPIFLALACSLSTATSVDETQPAPTDPPYFEAGQTIDPAEPNGMPEPTEAPDQSGRAPLFITTMTHMEGNHNDDQDETLFRFRVEARRRLATCRLWLPATMRPSGPSARR